jgi:hypothetical protein
MSEPERLPGAALQALDAALAPLDAWAARRYPGGSSIEQPVHTVYVPADRAEPGLSAMWGELALESLDENAGDAATLAEITGLAPAEVADAWVLLRSTLLRRPIEDLRVDLEDGYGPHSEKDEDAHADGAAATLHSESNSPLGPVRCGIRHRSLEPSTRHRAVRTLDRVLGRLVAAGGLPSGFVITLPKVIHIEQVTAYVTLLGALEQVHALEPGRLKFEIQVETPQAIVGPDGNLPLAPMLDAAQGRCTALHYGTYDYSAAMGVAAEHQHARHEVAQTAKAIMRLAAAGTGVEVSDGSTNKLPVGDVATVRANWRIHADLVADALADGIRQGWDLHPAQLVTRHLVTIVTMRRALPGATARLATYLTATAGGGAQDASAGATLDEPATAQALAADVMRAVTWGAANGEEIQAATGATLTELRALADRRVV